LWCCHRDHGHCESSPGLFDECRLSTGWPPTLRPSQPTWAVSRPINNCCHPRLSCCVCSVCEYQSVSLTASAGWHWRVLCWRWHKVVLGFIPRWHATYSAFHRRHCCCYSCSAGRIYVKICTVEFWRLDFAGKWWFLWVFFSTGLLAVVYWCGIMHYAVDSLEFSFVITVCCVVIVWKNYRLW